MLRKFVFLAAMALTASAQTRLVANVGNFIHDVSDVDRSLRFYRDVIGMDAPRPAGDWQTTDGILQMYDAIGGKFRVGNAQIPGSPMRVELVEFQGVERTPVQRPWGTAGTSILMLTVTNLAPVEERVKSSNTPVLMKTAKACDGQGLIVADPDGFAVMVVERGTAAPGATSNFTRVRFGYLVSGDAIAKGPFAALGLEAVTPSPTCQPVEEDLLGSRSSIVTLPGGFEIWLAKGKAPATQTVVRPRDPGAAVLRFAVSDTDAAVQALAKAQIKVVSAGAAIQTLAPGGLRAAILGAPDSLLIQVVK